MGEKEINLKAELMPISAPNYVSYQIGSQKLTLPIQDLTDEQTEQILEQFKLDFNRKRNSPKQPNSITRATSEDISNNPK